MAFKNANQSQLIEKRQGPQKFGNLDPCSGQYLSITKGNNSYIMQMEVMVIVHCTSPNPNLYTNEVSS